MLRVSREAARQFLKKPLYEGGCILPSARRSAYRSSIGCQATENLLGVVDGWKTLLIADQSTPLTCDQAPILHWQPSPENLWQTKAETQTSNQHGGAFSRTEAGRAESASQAGLPSGAPGLTRRALSQTVPEHLNSCGLGAFPGPLPNILPRPFTQPAAEPCRQPELHLWKHGSSIRDITLPAAGMNADVIPGLSNHAICGHHPKLEGMFSRNRGPVGPCYWAGFADSRMQSNRGFRTEARGSVLLAEENEGADVAVADQKPPDAVAEKQQKYGPKRSKRIPKSIIGNYDEEFEDELDLAEPSPWQDPLYNLRPRVDQFLMKEMGMNPHLDLEGLVTEADDEGIVSDIPDDYAGLPLVLRWETRFVLAPGPSAYHPLNRKVKLQCYLRDLELSEAAKERMIALVGPRYHTRRDELTLISQRYSHREENRKDVLRILYELIDEAKKVDKEEEEIAAAA